MISRRYARAYREVVEIYKYLSEDEKRKIPKEKMDFYRDNMDENYNFTIDPNISLQQQDISKEACAIIINLFIDYFSDETQRENLKQAFRMIEEIREKQNKY